MKRKIALLLLLALLLSLLSACAGEVPGEDASPDEPAPVEQTPAPSPTPAPVPETLKLGFSLPSAPEEEGTSSYYSPESEYDCAFLYPDYCELWTEGGTVRLNPGWFFARIILTPTRKDAEDAPGALLELFDPGKWSSVPSEITVGEGFDGLRMSYTKYDTYRRWIAWETEDFYYLLYGVCFDRYEDTLNEILDVVTSSYRPCGNLLVSAPESGTLLRSGDGLRILYTAAEPRAAEGGTQILLTLRIENDSGREVELLASSPAGEDGSFEARCALGGGESLDWPLAPVCTGGRGEYALSLLARAAGAESPLAELPIRITLE